LINHSENLGLKKEEPRAGKRKPIEDSEDEEDAKKVLTQILMALE
jgi:hypothetical protein